MYANVVGLRVLEEAYGFDFAETVDERLTNPMHAVHYTAVVGKDDGESEVAVTDESGVLSYLAAGDRCFGLAGPVGLVKFANGGQRHTLPGQGGREPDETANIPGAEALR
jgi:hypothetical protein